jgi:hypothetical protein
MPPAHHVGLTQWQAVFGSVVSVASRSMRSPTGRFVLIAAMSIR